MPMNPQDLSEEYGNIKAYCRKEAAKSFKDPRAPEPKLMDEGEKAAPPDEEMSDEELAELLHGEE